MLSLNILDKKSSGGGYPRQGGYPTQQYAAGSYPSQQQYAPVPNQAHYNAPPPAYNAAQPNYAQPPQAVPQQVSNKIIVIMLMVL